MGLALLHPKQLHTARARASLRGVALTRIEGDDGRPLYIASRQALCRSFDDIGQVEVWLDKVEGEVA